MKFPSDDGRATLETWVEPFKGGFCVKRAPARRILLGQTGWLGGRSVKTLVLPDASIRETGAEIGT
jgi:hypothetical protein